MAAILCACGTQDIAPVSDSGPADSPFVPPKKDASVFDAPYVPKGTRCVRDDDAAVPARWFPSPDASSDAGVPDEGGMPGDPLTAPQVLTTKGLVADKPVFIPITFDGDDLREEAEDFSASVGCTSWWRAAAGTYGIADAIGGTPIHVAEMAPMVISDAQVRQWLIKKLQSDPQFPKPTGPNVLYAIFYPSDTEVDAFGGKSCFAFGAYHSAFSYQGIAVPYAVMPRCGGLEQLTAVTSHEYIEYATDPTVGGFNGVTDEFSVWGFGYHEVGDMCSYASSSNYVPSDYPFTVQRSWSNKAAFLGENPCVPGDSAVWFAGIPVMTDAVTLLGGKMARGIKLPMGTQRTIEVKMIASGMTGSWNVDAQDLTVWTTGKPGLKFSWSKTQGSAGESLMLTLSRVGTSPNFGAAPFWISSTQGSDQHLWFGVAGD